MTVVALVVVLGVVAWTLPAQLAYRYAGGALAPLVLRDLDGTIWHGHAAGVDALGTNLGMATVAEGIEEFEQLNRVRSWGCKYGQGFLLGPPMTADNIRDFILARAPGVQTPHVPATPASVNPECGESGEPPASSQAA